MKASSPTSASAQAARGSRALIVPAHVLALEGITLTAKLILAEVLDLYKVKKHVFASDEHFAARLSIGLRTVGDAIKQLHGHGLLTRSIDPKARHKRQLTPTLPILSAADQPAKSLLNPQEDITPITADLINSSCEIRNESRQNPQRVPAKSADINTRVNIHSNSKLIPVGGKSACADPRPKKMNGSEIIDSTASLPSAPSSPRVAAAPPTSPPHAARSSIKATTKHAFAASPYADAEFFVSALQGTDYEHADLRYYHEVIRTWAESKDARQANWLPMMCNWMLRDSKDQKLKTSSSFSAPTHANTHCASRHRYETLDNLGATVDQYFETKYGR